jgi:hypothetical protein
MKVMLSVKPILMNYRKYIKTPDTCQMLRPWHGPQHVTGRLLESSSSSCPTLLSSLPLDSCIFGYSIEQVSLRLRSALVLLLTEPSHQIPDQLPR